jgi:hypothetical protein
MTLYYYSIAMEIDFPVLDKNSDIDSIKECIVQLHNNILSLNYTQCDNVSTLSNDFRSILSTIDHSINISFQSKCKDIIRHSEYISLLENIFCFVSYIRDIHMGLGIRNLSYHFIYELYDFFPEFTEIFVKHLFITDEYNHSIGSWRDSTGICDFLYTQNMDHPLIDMLVVHMNDILFSDLCSFNINGYPDTNVSKWIPRQTSKNKWLFEKLSIQWASVHTPHLMHHCYHSKSLSKAKNKCFMNYRKTVSTLSRALLTTEFFLSTQNKPLIDLRFITQNALVKHWNNLFSTKTLDSILCSHKLTNSIQNIHYINNSSPFTADYFHFPQSIDKFVTIALQCVSIIQSFQDSTPKTNSLGDTISNINRLWEFTFQKWNNVSPVDLNSIPVIHIQSISLQDPVFHRAISRACFIAQSSNIKRILVSTHVPVWINIENCTDFVSTIRHIHQCLSNEVLINTSIDNTIEFLGKNNPFIPIIINDNGFAYNHNHIFTYANYSSICSNLRYKNIQDSFQYNIHLINQRFQITL